LQFSSRGLWIKKPERKKRKVRFVGGKRRKGQHKSKASIAAGKRNAAKQKKVTNPRGVSIFWKIHCVRFGKQNHTNLQREERSAEGKKPRSPARASSSR